MWNETRLVWMMNKEECLLKRSGPVLTHVTHLRVEKQDVSGSEFEWLLHAYESDMLLPCSATCGGQ